jgi:hypothetical protein
MANPASIPAMVSRVSRVSPVSRALPLTDKRQDILPSRTGSPSPATRKEPPAILRNRATRRPRVTPEPPPVLEALLPAVV